MARIRRWFASERLDVSARFELLREAISGTMSDFYMARDRETGEVVGLKILNSEKKAAFDARFPGVEKPSEGEIATSLEHERIVKTLEYGLTTKGQHYLIMEFLEGPGLHTLIQRRDSNLEGKRLGLIRQMAEALQAVHEAGYIHRDFCPRNFICTPDAASLKLIDFGLTVPAKPEFTQPGNRTGTPLYMAPEIVRRRSTDQRVDIFALGVSCYYLCAHTYPWPVGDASGKTALTHDTHEPEPITAARPDLHPTLAKAIMRCLAADPNNRFPSADEFLRAIRTLKSETSDSPRKASS